jgi:hypothetical protein
MSRSFKKTKIRGIASAVSEKKNKQGANRKFRRITKLKIKIGNEELPQIREVSDIWCFDKDGKVFDRNMKKEDIRK